MANSPAMAPAAKCPTRIIFLIFFASAFLSWKEGTSEDQTLETLDRPCFFFWANSRGSCRFSSHQFWDYPWSSEWSSRMIIRMTRWTSTAGCIHLKWSGKSWWHGMKTSPIQSVSSKVAEKACQWLGGLGFYMFLYVYWHGKPQTQRSPLPN